MTSGKVFHTKAHARKRNEKYYTPAWATEAVMPFIDVSAEGWTWEPAAGGGDIVRVLQAHGARCIASDIDPDDGESVSHNFLTSTGTTFKMGNKRIVVNKIVTNPPFGTGGRLAFMFAWHALRLMEPVKGRVVMLMRDDFDSAGGRLELFANHPAFDKKVVLSERVRWVNLPQKKDAGPSGSHAWYIWSWEREAGPATLHYTGRRSDA